jgi:hypothetical protein
MLESLLLQLNRLVMRFVVLLQRLIASQLLGTPQLFLLHPSNTAAGLLNLLRILLPPMFVRRSRHKKKIMTVMALFYSSAFCKNIRAPPERPSFWQKKLCIL